MPTTAPYIFVSERMNARVDRWPETPQGSVTPETVQGYHAFWAARIPYIPAIPPDDGLNANEHIAWRLRRQISFLYNLAQIDVNSSTFELRYIADPRAGTEARVSVILLGKTFHPDRDTAARFALGQWERVSALFPSGPPDHYPLEAVTFKSDAAGTPPWEARGFEHWFEPISNAAVMERRFELVELRKHEDWPQRPIAARDLDYIPHHLVPPIDYTSMTRVLEALSRQRQTAYIGVTLRPQRLAPRERSQIARFANHYQRAQQGELLVDDAIIAQRRLDPNSFDALFLQRAALGKQVYGALNEQSEKLALFTVRVVAERSELTLLTQTIGSEMIANTGLAHPCSYDVVAPDDADPLERQWAVFNMRWLEMERWGVAQNILRFRDLLRLRFLVTMPEAVAAFRLPTASLGMRLPGIEVADEPFTSVPVEPLQLDDVTGLGYVTTNGVELAMEYRLPRRALAQGINLLGDESAMRGAVTNVLLAYLREQQIPVVVFGSRESETMCALLVGAGVTSPDASAAAQAIQAMTDAPAPFTPPEGVPLARWISAVARALALAYGMPTTACLALQSALTSAFSAAGGVPDAPWDQRLRVPDTAEVAASLTQEVAHGGLSAEMRRFFTDQLLPGLRELQHAPSLKMVQASPDPSSPLLLISERMEMYQSAVARAALTCASAAIALEQREANAPRANPTAAPRAALLLIEPHHLFPASRTGDQPLLPLLEGLRQAQCGVIVVTARPHLVDRQVFTGIIATQRLTPSESIALCQQLMRLSDREAQRLSVLNPHDTLWQHGGVIVQVRRANSASAGSRVDAPQGKPLLDSPSTYPSGETR